MCSSLDFFPLGSLFGQLSFPAGTPDGPLFAHRSITWHP